MNIRSATTKDAASLLEIYSYYVENTAISFEIETPSLDEFTNRVEATLRAYPYLVVEDGGRICGYSYAGPFKTRAAYNRSCEVSIYVDKDARRRGYGRALYGELEKRLKAMGILNMYVCIASPIVEDEYLTRSSELFHERIGFSKAGVFHQCSYKFDRWYNMICMEKIIGEHV